MKKFVMEVMHDITEIPAAQKRTLGIVDGKVVIEMPFKCYVEQTPLQTIPEFKWYLVTPEGECDIKIGASCSQTNDPLDPLIEWMNGIYGSKAKMEYSQ